MQERGNEAAVLCVCVCESTCAWRVRVHGEYVCMESVHTPNANCNRVSGVCVIIIFFCLFN